MKSKYLSFLLLAALGALSATTSAAACAGCCSHSSAEAALVGDKAASSSLSKGTFSEALPNYFTIQKALAADDLATATGTAKDAAEITGDNCSLASDLGAIAKAHDIKSARRAFKTLSNVMISAAESYDASGDETVYKAYCPMAFGNTGAAWLQDSEQLANPYFGSMMLRCGSIQKVDAN